MGGGSEVVGVGGCVDWGILHRLEERICLGVGRLAVAARTSKNTLV